MTSIPVLSTDLQQLFLSLAPIDSVSLNERRIADILSERLKKLGVSVFEDQAGAKLHGTSGNLICLPPGFDRSAPCMVLAAHLDTVESTALLKPIVLIDRITSDGNTILGGDCRLGVTVLIYLMEQIVHKKIATRNFMVVFTVGEEIGLLGAREIDLAPYLVDRVYIFDSSRRPGMYIQECVGLHEFTAEFIGKASHSGVAPEEGINAISMAAKAIAATQLGRISPDTTANIGKISGGNATNIVPDRVTIEGEVRSFYPEKIKEQLDMINKTFLDALNGIGRYTFESHPDFEPYRLDSSLPAIQDLEKALRKVHLTPQPLRYTGGSDANMYNLKGIPAINLGTGAQKPHTHEEYVLLEDMMKSAEIAFSLVMEHDER